MPGTVHPEVPIDDLTETLTSALGDELVGLYAYGSAVSGGYDPGVSDIDLVAVTAGTASGLPLETLDAAHQQVLRRHPAWENRLEVVYVGATDLRDFRESDAALAVISPGEAFHLSGPLSDWTQNWALLGQTGVALSGRPAAEVVPPIGHDEYLAAVAAYARWLAAQDLEAHAPGSLAYAVLSTCRAICTIRTGRACSKQEGAAWLASEAPQHASLLEEALAVRRSGGALGFGDAATRAAAITFVRSMGQQGS